MKHYGLIGYPLTHSFSKKYFTEKFEREHITDAVYHTFPLEHRNEGPRFAVGLDAFNITNRVNYVTYIGNLSSPFFGVPVAAKPPRRLQVSGRFEF